MQKRGFTLVELLIVIVVIAILAAITIVAYNGVQQRARIAVLQNDLSEAVQFMGTYAVDHGGQYPSTLLDAHTAGLKLATPDSQLVYGVNNAVNPATWGLTAMSTDGSLSYGVNNVRSTPFSGSGWITNLVTNPNSMGGSGTTTLGQAQYLSSVGSTSGLATPTGTGFLTVPNNSSNDSELNFGDQLPSPTLMSLGMVAGQTYTASGYVYLPQAQTSVNLRPTRARAIAVFADSPTNVVEIADSPQAPNTANTTTRLSVTFTLPQNTTGAFIRWYNGSDKAADTVVWSDLMLTQGSTLYTYADGNSSGWSWSGTTNASTSSGPAL